MLWQFGPPMSVLGLQEQDIIQTVSIIICIETTGLRLMHIGKTDPRCGTVQFCFRSGRLTCSARQGILTAKHDMLARRAPGWQGAPDGQQTKN